MQDEVVLLMKKSGQSHHLLPHAKALSLAFKDKYKQVFLGCMEIWSLELPPSTSFTYWTSPEPACRLTRATTIGSTSQTAFATYGSASMYPSRASVSTMPSPSGCVLSPGACSQTLRTYAPHYGELVTQVVTVVVCVVSYSFDNVQRHTHKAAVCRRSSRHHVQVVYIAVGRSSRTKEGQPSSKRAWPSSLCDRGRGFMLVIYKELFAAHHSHKKPLGESLKHFWERVERGSSLKSC